jgi:hypothetical protein
MIARPLTAKEESTIEYYCEPTSETFNNWIRSYVRAGYSSSKGYQGNAERVRAKEVVKAGIDAYKARTANRTARTVQSVDDMYAEMYTLAKSLNQPSAGVSACTGIARLYGMDKDNDTSDTKTVEIEANQIEATKELAKAMLERSLDKPSLKLA